MEKEFIISSALLQAIADYLSQRPYREVAPLLSALVSLRQTERLETSGNMTKPNGTHISNVESA